MDKELRQATLDFLLAFEEVFDKDWEYTQEQLCIMKETEQERTERLENPDDFLYRIHPDGTFVNPKVDDEIEDWGYRGKLLKKYRELKTILANS